MVAFLGVLRMKDVICIWLAAGLLGWVALMIGIKSPQDKLEWLIAYCFLLGFLVLGPVALLIGVLFVVFRD